MAELTVSNPEYPNRFISKWNNREVYEPGYRDRAEPGPEYNIQNYIEPPATAPLYFTAYRPDKGEVRLVSDYDWITVTLLLTFGLFAFAKYNFAKRMSQMIMACVVPRALTPLYREGNPFNEQVTLVLGIIYLLTSSLFIYIFLEYFNWLPDDLVKRDFLYLGILILNAAYLLLKTLANRILAHIFKTHEAANNYLLNSLLFNLTLGVFFLISLPLVVYTGSAIIFKITLLITAIALVYKVLRGVLIGLSINRFPLFYLILYICTLEVAPLLLIAKFFMT